MADRRGSGFVGRAAGALLRMAGPRRAERVEERVIAAAEAPRDIMEDVREGLREVAPYLARFVLAAAMVVLLAATAWVVFAVALVAVGTAVFGEPGGVVAAFVVLALAALGGFAWARSALRLVAEEGAETREEVREDLERVVEGPYPPRYGDAAVHPPPGGA